MHNRSVTGRRSLMRDVARPVSEAEEGLDDHWERKKRSDSRLEGSSSQSHLARRSGIEVKKSRFCF